MSQESITLGGGCFWCTEAVFKAVRGMVDVESGYCNGHVLNPSYEQVCQGTTGHVEVVRLRFDPSVIRLEQILEIFFHIHDPTTLNRQGADVGSQYRSGIYPENLAHTEIAESMIQKINQSAVFGKPVVTELHALKNYFPAEDYHQDYFEKHPGQGYCALVVGPKVEKFQKTFRDLLQSDDRV